jgi:hypothetical protein
LLHPCPDGEQDGNSQGEGRFGQPLHRLFQHAQRHQEAVHQPAVHIEHPAPGNADSDTAADGGDVVQGAEDVNARQLPVDDDSQNDREDDQGGRGDEVDE